MRYTIAHPETGETIGYFDLDPLPGCPEVGVSHAMCIFGKHRGKGYGARALEERCKLVKTLGFAMLICTVASGNKPQEKLLPRAGFRSVSFFDNERTGNRVVLWVKNLNDPYDCGFFEPGGCR